MVLTIIASYLLVDVFVFLRLHLYDPQSQEFARFRDNSSSFLIPATILTAHVFCLLYFLTEVFLAASPGKIALRMTIMGSKGTEATSSALWYRWLLKNSYLVFGLAAGVCRLVEVKLLASLFLYASYACTALVFLGFLRALGCDKTTLYDKLAGTAVFDLRGPSSCET